MADFTKQLEEMERENAARMAGMSPIYRREERQDYLPGLTVTLYVNQSDPDDMMISAQSACRLVGLNKNWLTQAFSRPKTIEKLKRFGFSGERKLLDVVVPKSKTSLTKPSTGLDRQDFDSIINYADALGKTEAVAIRIGFMALGLIAAGGLENTPEESRKIFVDAYQEVMRLTTPPPKGGGFSKSL